MIHHHQDLQKPGANMQLCIKLFRNKEEVLQLWLVGMEFHGSQIPFVEFKRAAIWMSFQVLIVQCSGERFAGEMLL